MRDAFSRRAGEDSPRNTAQPAMETFPELPWVGLGSGGVEEAGRHWKARVQSCAERAIEGGAQMGAIFQKSREH